MQPYHLLNDYAISPVIINSKSLRDRAKRLQIRIQPPEIHLKWVLRSQLQKGHIFL